MQIVPYSYCAKPESGFTGLECMQAGCMHADHGASLSTPGACSEIQWLLIDGDPMLLQLAPNKWCCMLCRRQAATLEDLLTKHCREPLHMRKEAEGRLNGRVTNPGGLVRLARRAYAALASSLGRILDASIQHRWGKSLFLAVADAYLCLFADKWSSSVPPPPSLEQTMGAGQAWSPEACGVHIRSCDDSRKGQGVFATHPITAGTTVGMYLGELLTQAQYFSRHVEPALEDVARVQERSERLGKLRAGDGAPMGGVSNGGAYVFGFFPPGMELPAARLAFIDAEDHNLSSWTRFINSAPAASPSCNLSCKVNAHRAHVWFVAIRDIAMGEELHFDYRNGGAHWLHQRMWQ